MRHVFAGLAIAAALFAMVTAPTAAASGTAPVAHVQRIRVGGDTVTLDCTGAGSPTVILFAGFNAAHTTWAHVQRRLSQRTRVCSYDRLGEGSSSAPRHTMTLASNTRLLHRVLAKARVRGPLVLVGHSLGGDVAVKYARTYRRATVGVVLFDASPPGFLQYVLRLIPASAHGLAATLRAVSAGIITGDNRERVKVAGRSVAPGGVVGPHAAGRGRTRQGHLRAGRPLRRLQGGWARGQRQLARLSRRSQLIIATNSGHNIYLDQPQLALDVINAVIGGADGLTAAPRCYSAGSSTATSSVTPGPGTARRGRQQHPAVHPPARRYAAMAYDAATGAAVLFGGGGRPGLLGDTSTWE